MRYSHILTQFLEHYFIISFIRLRSLSLIGDVLLADAQVSECLYAGPEDGVP